MRFNGLSQDAVCELLYFLAENEDFPSLDSLKGTISKKDAREIIKEIADQIKKNFQEEETGQRPHYSEHHLSAKALSIISCLSPREESLLFKSFKLI